MFLTAYTWLFVLVVVWEMIWKGFALWKSAQKGQTAWFVAILILNTIGILPIIYLLIENSKEKGGRLIPLKVRSARRAKKKGRRR